MRIITLLALLIVRSVTWCRYRLPEDTSTLRKHVRGAGEQQPLLQVWLITDNRSVLVWPPTAPSAIFVVEGTLPRWRLLFETENKPKVTWQSYEETQPGTFHVKVAGNKTYLHNFGPQLNWNWTKENRRNVTISCWNSFCCYLLYIKQWNLNILMSVKNFSCSSFILKCWGFKRTFRSKLSFLQIWNTVNTLPFFPVRHLSSVVLVIFSTRTRVSWLETAVGSSETFDRWTGCRTAPDAATANWWTWQMLWSSLRSPEHFRSNRRSIYQGYGWKCPSGGSISQKFTNIWLIHIIRTRWLCFTRVHDSVMKRLTNRTNIWTRY